MMRVISGGQTGVDQAALRAARECGIATGGWAPRRWVTEEGTASWLADYGLQECDKVNYAERTRKNVAMAGAIMVLIQGKINGGQAPNGGTALTIQMAAKSGKPMAVFGLDDEDAEPFALDFLKQSEGKMVMIAGPRESKFPGIGDKAFTFLKRLFEAVKTDC